MTSRHRTTSAVLLVVLLIGLAALGWAVFSSSSGCVYPSPDYGVCTDNSALKWEIGILGAILVIVSMLTYWISWKRWSNPP